MNKNALNKSESFVVTDDAATGIRIRVYWKLPVIAKSPWKLRSAKLNSTLFDDNYLFHNILLL